MRRLFLFIPLLLAVGFGVLLWKGLGQNPNNQDNAIVGRTLPDIRSTDLFIPSQHIDLRSYLGKPFVLNVWASWCVNCRAEHQFLVRLSETVPIYGINYRDKPEAARRWLEQTGNPYRSVLNDEQGKLALELGVYGTPETLLFSSDGILLARYTGALDEKIWADVFAPRLSSIVSPERASP